MKSTFFSLISGIILLFCGLNGYGQATANNTYSLALARALNRGKLLRLVVAPTASLNIAMVDPVTDPEVSRALDPDFISVSVARGFNRQADSLLNEFSITTFPAILYIDSKGRLFSRSTGYTSKPGTYIKAAKEAKEFFKRGKNLSVYRDRFNSGDRSLKFIGDYIRERQRMGARNNSELAQAYADQLGVKDFDNFKEVVFILEAGPLLNSKAYILTHLNKKLIDSIFTTLPFQRRVAINNLIIENSRREAIRKKDVEFAYAIAGFAAATHGSDQLAASRASQSNMLNYYRGVRDTVQLIPQLIGFVDAFYMNISADSARRLDIRQIDSARTQAGTAVARRAVGSLSSMTGVSSGTSLVVRQMPAGATGLILSPYTIFLNTSALEVYQSGYKNPRYLNRAIAWTQRAIDIHPNSTFYNTRAHLLYRQGLLNEAIIAGEIAIDLAVQEKRSDSTVAFLLSELQKIQEMKL